MRNEPNLEQHEDSVINTVTIEGTTLGSLSSTVRNRRPLEYDVLDGLADAERVNVIRRILRAYENGLNTIDPEFPADDTRNQAKVALLEPGLVIEYDSASLGQTFTGPVSGLRWRWEGTRAFVRANVEVQPPPPDLYGVRLYLTGSTFPDSRQLFIVDVETGLATRVDVGITGGGTGLAYDANHDILYSTDGANLYRINTTTGVGTLIGSHGLSQFHPLSGMAYDTMRDVLRAGSSVEFNGRYYEVNTTTGAATEVPSSPSGFGHQLGVLGMAYDRNLDQIIVGGDAVISPGEIILRLEPATGAVISTLSVEVTGIRALAYDNDNRHLYAVVGIEGLGSGEDFLYRIGPTGILNRIGTSENFGLGIFNTTISSIGLAYMSLGLLLPALPTPTGLALTESGGDITADWDAATDATGYVLEWREEGSGDVWQTVDVSAPPHTFTP